MVRHHVFLAIWVKDLSNAIEQKISIFTAFPDGIYLNKFQYTKEIFNQRISFSEKVNTPYLPQNKSRMCFSVLLNHRYFLSFQKVKFAALYGPSTQENLPSMVCE